mmetsp:Transcript_6363/g.10050  ORF Transcript_6363/g.10050 Transcript_6363/m.10050 type:complete len:101 (+) Transcript_6363:494-796(+)
MLRLIPMKSTQKRREVSRQTKALAAQRPPKGIFCVNFSAGSGYTKKQLPINEKKRLFPDFLAVNPNGLVPALDNGGEKLYESLQVTSQLNGTAIGWCSAA